MQTKEQIEHTAWLAGRDCAINGANTKNCRFSYFALTEITLAWERGKKAGEWEKTRGPHGLERVDDGAERQACIWRQDEDGNWLTTCRNLFVLIDGTPKENRMKFCCYCGKLIRPPKRRLKP